MSLTGQFSKNDIGLRTSYLPSSCTTLPSNKVKCKLIRVKRLEQCPIMLLGMRYILWARGHIRDLEDLVSGGRGHGDLEKWNCDISLRFGVLCRYTAFVAVDRSEKIDLDGKPHHVTQAVESPEGWNMLLQPDLMFDDSIQCCVRARKPRSIHMQYGPHESDTLSETRASIPKKSKSLAGGLGSVRSDLLSFRKKIRHEGLMDEMEIPEDSEIETLNEAIECAGEILKDLRDALSMGTHNLAQAMFDRRKKIDLLAKSLTKFGFKDDLVKTLKQIVETLNFGTAPSSTTTVRLWERLEDALEGLIAG